MRTVSQFLLLPDRELRLHILDDSLDRTECLRAMLCSDGDDHRILADLQMPHAVPRNDAMHTRTILEFHDDVPQNLLR